MKCLGCRMSASPGVEALADGWIPGRLLSVGIRCAGGRAARTSASVKDANGHTYLRPRGPEDGPAASPENSR